MTFLRHMLIKVRRARQDRCAYNALVDVPATGSLTLPANGRFAFKATSPHTAGQTVCTVTGPHDRTIKCKLMATGAYMHLDALERGSVVSVKTGFDMFLDMGLGVYVKIATGV